jgi:two-component system cell cycle response regulator
MSASQGFRTLLILSDPKEAEMYTHLLEEIGPSPQVDVFQSADGALAWTLKFNYQLVVIDLSDVGGEGLALLERIKRTSPVTSVILISGKASIEEAVNAVRLGAEDYLQKPLKVDAFKLAVRRGLDRKVIFGESANAANFILLLSSCQLVSASLEQSKIFEIVRSYLSRELGTEHTAIYKIDTGQPVRSLDDPNEAGEDRAVDEMIDIALHASQPLQSMVELKETARFIERGALSPGLFIFRFKCMGDEDFFCVCLSPKKPGTPEAFEGRLRMLKAQLELTGKNIEHYQGVQELAYRDDATGLYNTRYLIDVLDQEIAASAQKNSHFAVLFMDVDHFKKINDVHGHLVGTRILNEVGKSLKTWVRDRDTVFRYGGDEFVAVLSGCDLQTATMVAERVRASVEATIFQKDESLNIRITVSIGVALYPDHAKSREDVVSAADHAMYKAKNRTRNSVFIAPMPGDEDQEGKSAQGAS